MDAGAGAHVPCTVRVVNMYATPWRFIGKLHNNEGTPADLGGLEQHYELYKERLPRLLPCRVLGHRMRGDVVLAHAVEGFTVNNAKAELLTLPSKQVVLTVTMSLAGGVLADEQQAEPIVEVLEQCILGDIKIGECIVADALSADFHEWPTKDFFSKDAPGGSLLPERHQLVFVARSTPEQPVPSQQIIDKILYRRHPPYRPEFVDPRMPKQLNSQPSQPQPILGVVTPYVSLLYGQREYVEAALFLSTAHALGTAARIHYISLETYQQLEQAHEQRQMTSADRIDLETIADTLGNLQYDLNFSVGFSLLHVETFRSELYELMELDTQAKTLNQMFDQMSGGLRWEITAIEIREQQSALSRERWDSVKAALLSIQGVVVSLAIALFPMVSMGDPRAATVFLVASSFALTPLFLVAVPYLREFAHPRTRRNRRPLILGMATMVFGVAIFLSALISGRHQTGSAQLFDAIATASGAFFTMIGLTTLLLLLLRAWPHQLRHLWGRLLNRAARDKDAPI